VVDAAVQTAKATDAVRAGWIDQCRIAPLSLRERKTLDADIARNPATRHASPVWLADRLRARLAGALDPVVGCGAMPRRRCGCASIVSARRTIGYLETLREAGIGARARKRGCLTPVVLDSPART